MPVRVVIREDMGRVSSSEAPSLSFDGSRVVIGRGEGCDVRLPDPSVSPRHATLRQHGGTYLLVDEGSTNGTFLGGVRLAAQAPRVVEDGARIRLGRVWLELRFDVSAQQSTREATKELALALVQRALQADSEEAVPRVVVREGPDQGKSLRLPETQKPYSIGRGHGVDLLLDEPDASRKHLELVRRGDVLYVRDVGSKNGTFLGDVELELGKDTVWKLGETLALGADVFTYENPVAEALAEIERSADEKMREGESVPDPGATPSPPTTEANDASPPEGAAPVAVQPKTALAKSKPRASGWGPSDLLIVAIAIAVLALSAGGLFLLFRS
jgi:pSer/pThr/pTyr-binding forkhead associated (FHA) protein